MKHYDVIVIGASQAGLAASYYLQQQKKNFLVLEAADSIGKAWADRYDSLRLFTSVRYNNLPGLAFPGDQDHFPLKDEVAAYLQMYAARFEFPVLLNHKVAKLSRSGEIYLAETAHERFIAKNVIVCTGALQKPFIPFFSRNIDNSILQLHTSSYKNPAQLNPGDILVVGGGNSGVQIAEELLNHGRKVFFSYSRKLRSLPNNKLTQRLIFGSGITSASIHSLIGKFIQKRPEPIMATDLKKLFSDPNITMVGKTILAARREISCSKVTVNSAQNIIWATGFKPDFNWINVDVFDKAGLPMQQRGVTKSAGLFFLGLAWMHSRKSGLLGGVKADAEFITTKTI